MFIGRKRKMKTRTALLLIAACLIFTGCNRTQLKEDINTFDAAVKDGSKTIAEYYNGLNAQEYDLYFELLQIDPSFEVGDYIVYELRDEAGKVTQKVTMASPLKEPPFPQRSIDTRIRLLRELSNYSNNLAELAGSDAPKRFDDNTQTFANNLRSLKNTFENLGKDEKKDPTASRFVTPIATIIGVVGKWSLERKRWNTLRSSIIEASRPINVILDQIARDLDSYVDPLTDLAANDRYTTAIVYYNLRKKDMSADQRSKALASIRQYKEAYDTAAHYKPSTIPKRIKSVHEELVKVAKYNRTPQDLASLRGELSEFVEDVERLRNAVQTIRNKK